MDGFRSSRAAGGARRRMGGPRRAELTARPPRPLQPRLRGGGRGGPCDGEARADPRRRARPIQPNRAAARADRLRGRCLPDRDAAARGRAVAAVSRGIASARNARPAPDRRRRASRTQRGACGDRWRAHDGAFRAAHVARAGAGLKPAPESPPRAASASLKGRRRAASDAFRAPSRRSPSRAPACRLAARGAAGA